MGIRWPTSGTFALWRVIWRYVRIVGRWICAWWEWVLGKNHGRWARDSSPPKRSGNSNSNMPVTRITDEELKEMFDNLPAIARENGTMESLGLGNFVVRKFLSNAWANDRIVPTGKKKGFLTIDESTPERRETTLYRVIDLAEVLINLQNIHGFDGCISKLRKGDIEGTYAELDLGRLLYAYKVDFRYVRQTGKKGADYDVEITFPDGTIACTEAKCKIESTEFGAHKVRSSLNKAVDQVPDDRPCIGFVKVPQHWLEHPYFRPLMRQVAREFLADNPKFVSVKYYVSHLSFEPNATFTDGVMRHRHAFEEVPNPTNCFDTSRDWKLFYTVDVPPSWNGMPPHWKRILFYPDGKMR
jgi:hypothetical protein